MGDDCEITDHPDAIGCSVCLGIYRPPPLIHDGSGPDIDQDNEDAGDEAAGSVAGATDAVRVLRG